MNMRRLQRAAFFASALVGIALIAIGARFLFAPEAGEQGYGLVFNEQGNYAFHYIKGIRDIFAGLIVVIFALQRQRTTLAIVLGVGILIPLVDMLIVLTNAAAIPGAAWIHGITVVLMALLVLVLAAKPHTAT